MYKSCYLTVCLALLCCSVVVVWNGLLSFRWATIGFCLKWSQHTAVRIAKRKNRVVVGIVFSNQIISPFVKNRENARKCILVRGVLQSQALKVWWDIDETSSCLLHTVLHQNVVWVEVPVCPALTNKHACLLGQLWVRNAIDVKDMHVKRKRVMQLRYLLL